MPAYQRVLKLGRERNNPVFVDIGCCCKLVHSVSRAFHKPRNGSVGDNIRRIVADGFLVDGVLGFDIEKGMCITAK